MEMHLEDSVEKTKKSSSNLLPPVRIERKAFAIPAMSELIFP